MYTRFQTKTAQKTLPDGAAHTYIASIGTIYLFLPPPPPPHPDLNPNKKRGKSINVQNVVKFG